MTLNEIRITTQGVGMEEALEATEELGMGCGLGDREILHLRLLAEELFGMVRSIAGNLEGKYWVEQETYHYEIHLRSDVEMTKEMYKRFISVSSQGSNAAVKGFMGKIRDMIAVAMLPKEEEDVSMVSVGLMSMGSPSGLRTESTEYVWSMDQYKAAVDQNRSADEKAREAWDELEKSIVASIADEVSVRIVGSQVEITIIKNFLL